VSNKKSKTKTMELWIAINGFIGLAMVGLVVVVFGMEISQAGVMAFRFSSMANTAMPSATSSWFEYHGIDSLVLGPDGCLTSP
jgi:hypothetical protein